MIIGIDPGLTGAVAVLAPDGALEAVCDTPTLMLRTSRGTRQEYDVPGLAALLAPYSGPQSHVLIEEAQSMPQQGVRSMFTCGLGMGIWLGVLAALKFPYTRVRLQICGSADITAEPRRYYWLGTGARLARSGCCDSRATPRREPCHEAGDGLKSARHGCAHASPGMTRQRSE